MTQVVSVSAQTAAYAMEAVKPPRRIAAADQARDARVDSDRNAQRLVGGQVTDVEGLIPAVPLSFDITAGQNGRQQQHTSMRYAEEAYKEI
ncbi:hypothetical protein [Rhizobium sp. FY34]|uniref:hypothetical protein n=1 Tax=Rhizobium sp. FY34 TaxID=2562309 RepID=UPI0010BFD768|nr:hypothetical protein [Rhizobium sp. FY34]